MELKLPVFKVEVAMPNFLLRGGFQPRGDFLVFLNDLSYTYFRFDEVDLLTLTPDFQVPGVKQPKISLNRLFITYVAVLEEEAAALIQVLQNNRPAVFYTGWCAIRGNLHVNPDSHEDNLLSGGRDFFAVSDVSIFPMKPVTGAVTRKTPIVLINRRAINAYHIHKPAAE